MVAGKSLGLTGDTVSIDDGSSDLLAYQKQKQAYSDYICFADNSGLLFTFLEIEREYQC